MGIMVKVLDAAGLKAFIGNYKAGVEYHQREKQTAFCRFARQVIEGMLDNRPNRRKWDMDDLTALINVFKQPHNADRFMEKYFESNLRKLEFPDDFHYRIMGLFRALPEEALGYTAAGLHSITKISQDEVDAVHMFMAELSTAESIGETRKAVIKYQEKEVPQVTAGIFSPWAHYLHPRYCPIINRKSRKMFKDIGFDWDGDYSTAMDVFQALGEKFGIEDLGLVDRLVSSERLRSGLENLIKVRHK